MEIKTIIIGSKEIDDYIPAVVYELSKGDCVLLSSAGRNINKMERLIRLFTDLSLTPVKEIDRKQETIKGKFDATIVRLERIRIEKTEEGS